MTTLIFDWSELLGEDASGSVRVRATRWRKEPETLGVPWFRDQRFTGRATMDVDPGLVLELTWTPSGQHGSLHQTIVVPDEGEHLAHLLAVDPESLDPVGRDRAAWELIDARLEALESRPAPDVDLTGYATEEYVDAVVAAIPTPAPSTLLRDPETGDYYTEA